ncbi:MAG: hypothetical protein ACRDPL_14155 [Propionibacteriaceae bacterium]
MSAPSSSARRPAIHGLAASMQMGVEIHLHQGKPEARAANTHCVGQALWLITHEANF